ncbi:MAG: hypothetical protein E7Z92_07075 [Cyanobacteria bacterium SIG31]|nr:hypothetical protein [Cyanobacteria bacterium SIG31]
MTEKRSRGFTVISNSELEQKNNIIQEYSDNINYQTNPMYEKLLNFRNLQEAQKKKFSVDDLFKLC